MIRGLLARLPLPSRGHASAGSAATVRELRAEVERLEAQNEKLRSAMRQCVECEYRIEVLRHRSEDGRSAAGDDLTEPA